MGKGIQIIISVILLSISAIASAGQEKADTLDEAVITDRRLARHNETRTQTGHKNMDRLDLIRGNALMSTPDIIKILQNMPGVASGTELMSGLYVHGGDGTDNLFLLDGVPLYQVTHVGGFFSSFNTDIIKGLDFYKSGFPARYGGRLSSVVDVRTSDGDFHEYHGNISVGLIDGRIQLEGPISKGKTSFNIAARRTWLTTVLRPMIRMLNKRNEKKGNPDTFDGRYNFYDLNLNITHRFSSTDKLYLRVYNGKDKLYLSSSEHKTEEIRTANSILEKKTDIELSDDIVWGNLTTSVEWQKEIRQNMTSSIMAYWTGSRSDVKYALWHNEAVEGNTTADSQTDERNRTGLDDLGLKADFYLKAGQKHFLRFGASYEHHMYRPEREWKYSSEELQNQGKSTLRYSGDEAALYAEDEIGIGDAMDINAGLRYVMFSAQGKVWNRLEPRAAISFRCGENVSTRLSYSEMNQFAHLISTAYLDLPTNCWMPSTPLVPPSHSKQVAGGIYSRLPHDLYLNLEGYYKIMDNLLEYGGANTLFPPLDSWEHEFNQGRGKSYGMELEAGWETERSRIAAYYTLSWSLRKFDDIYHSWYPDRNDNRHKLTLTGSHRFGKNIEIFATWNWKKGNRMTVESHIYDSVLGNTSYYSAPNNIQLPDYHRLDLGADFHIRSRRGNESIWNISIYNAYCRKNAVFATVEIKEDGSYKGSGKAIFPILPSFSYTFRF